MAKLSDMPNIGTVVEQELIKSGIETPEELRRIGSREAFLRIRIHADPEACKNKLYGLEGAVQNIRWHNLPPETKQSLKEFHNSLKGIEV